MEYLVTNYGKDPTITNLLNTTTIHLMPTMNPDGFAAANATDCKGVQGRLEFWVFVYSVVLCLSSLVVSEGIPLFEHQHQISVMKLSCGNF